MEPNYNRDFHNHKNSELQGQTPEKKFDALNSTNFLDFQEKFEQEAPKSTTTLIKSSGGLSQTSSEPNHSMNGAEEALEKTGQLTDELQKQNELYERMINKEWTLGEQLMNRSMYRQVQSMKKDMLATTSRARLKVYDTILQARLDFIREHCNAALTVVKSKYRLEIAKAFTEHLEELYRTIIYRRANFVVMTLAESDETDKIPNMRVRQKINESIVKGEDRYIEMLDNLLIHYSNILKGLVNSD